MIKGKRPVYKSATCAEYSMTREEVLALDLKVPPYQADLNMTKVDEMIASHAANEEFMRFKNTIVVAVSITGMFLVDGQHRVEMMRRVAIKTPFRVLLYTVKKDEDMQTLFREMNYDSHKNLAYVSLGADAALMVNEVMAVLATKPFTKKRQASMLFTVRGFLDALGDYVARFRESATLLSDLEEKHQRFKERVDFTQFYAEERPCVEAAFIMPIKGCNFVEFVLHGADPKYVGKGTKICRTIPLTLKRIVWNKYVGLDKGEAECFVCHAFKIYQMSFHCGHVVAKSQGGANTVENLRPICQSCNSSMGSVHMQDFKQMCHGTSL
jgi:hypothetical protein